MSSTPVIGGTVWMDEEVGYDERLLHHPERIQIAIRDPHHIWSHLSSTFSRYQPFDGLQVKNQSGELQKVEDLYADVIEMRYRDELIGRSNYATPKQQSQQQQRKKNGTLSITTSEMSQNSPDPLDSLSSSSTSAAAAPSLRHPINWHYYPYLHIFLCTTINLDEYQKVIKPQIKKFMEYFVQPGMLNGGSTTASNSSTPASTPASSTRNSASSFSAQHTVPELRYHSEVLILYAPLLEDAPPPTPSGIASLFTSKSKKSSSPFGTPSSSSPPVTAAGTPTHISASTSAASAFSSIFSSTPNASSSNSNVPFAPPSFTRSFSSSSSLTAEDRLTQIKAARKLYERLKTDFGGSKDAMMSQTVKIDAYDMLKIDANGNVSVSSNLETPELQHQWDEFIGKIVRTLIRTHEHRTVLYEYELKTSLINSHLSGWNVNSYLALKESYAKIHIQMSLKNDALRYYEEMRQKVEEMMKEAKSANPTSVITSMPGPILDIFSRDYPLAVYRGELNEMELIRYLTAHAIWLRIKMHKNVSYSGPAVTSSASSSSTSSSTSGNNYLCDILRIGSDLIFQLLHRIETHPSRYSILSPQLFTWMLEAIMDLGILCEKYLIQNYVATYQLLTTRVLTMQQQQQSQQSSSTSLASSSASRSKRGSESGFSNVMAAVAAVIVPSSIPSSAQSSPSMQPVSTTTVVPPLSTSTSANASSTLATPSLQNLTKSLKLAHEADLKVLQNLRGDLYGFLLERLSRYGRDAALTVSTPTHAQKWMAEVTTILNHEMKHRPVQSLLTSAASSSPVVRIGIDDDVYADMLEEYYPYEHNLNTTSTANEELLNNPDGNISVLEEQTPKVYYALFNARHQRILSCFDPATSPASTDSSDTPTFSDLFLELCTCCLRMYWLSGRYRLCTRIAEMKACVYYTNTEYTKALDLFLSNSDRWRKDRWIQLYYPSLIMAIKCQQRLGRHDEVVRSCLIYLLTAHHHTSSSRFRPGSSTGSSTSTAAAHHHNRSSLSMDEIKPAPMAQVSWSRIGAMIAAVKQKEKDSSGGILPSAAVTAPPELAINASNKKSKKYVITPPLLSYTFPMLPAPQVVPATSDTTQAVAPPLPSPPPSIHSSLPPIVQIVQVQNDDSVLPPAAVSSSSHAPTPSSDCPSFLFDCCPHLHPSDSNGKEITNGFVSPIYIQELLMHTLQYHMGSKASNATATSGSAHFHSLRALSHRPSSLSPIFPLVEDPPSPSPFSPNTKRTKSGSSASSSSTSKRISASYGTSLSAAPVQVQTGAARKMHQRANMNGAEGIEPSPLNTNNTPTLSPLADSLPSGSYIESSLHPFFLFRTASLHLYRKSHPLHAVLEVDIDSRFASTITVDQIAFVIAMEREAKKVDDKQTQLVQQKTPSKRISVVVAAPPLPAVHKRQSSLGLAINKPSSVPILLPVPSPLPSQTLHKSTSMENFVARVNESTEMNDRGIEASVSPDSVFSDSASPEVVRVNNTQDRQPSSTPSLARAGTHEDVSDTNRDEWTCCFRDVVLQPGVNHVFFHIFHSAPEPELGESEGELGDQVISNVPASSTARHYSVVLYHTFSQLEQLHLAFEASHAHMQEVVDRRHLSVASLGSSPRSSKNASPRRKQSASPLTVTTSSVVHSYWTTKLLVRDIWFNIAQLHMWHIDLRAFHTILKTHIQTRAQRRKQYPKDEVDPHTLLQFVSASPLYKPFSGKPRLSIDILPLAASSLLIGKTLSFNMVVQILVGSPSKDDDEDTKQEGIERCVLHCATHSVLRLFGRERGGMKGGAHSRRESSDGQVTAANANTVCGLLMHEGKSEQKTFSVNLLNGDITLGTLPTGARLLLLLPIHTPSHLYHLLQTKQLTLPSSSSLQSSPHTSLPSSPSASRKRQASDMRLDDQAAAEENDKHSVRHAFNMDLTCAPILTTPAPSSAPTLPSFMFSSSHTLTFMEPIQLRASIERLGYRWFLQFFIWNRCQYPLVIRAYQLELPKGFLLQRDPNTAAVKHVLQPLNDADSNTLLNDADAALMPGASAALNAASVPISYTSPNVYGMVFELIVDDGSNKDLTSTSAPSHRSTLSYEDLEDEARLTSSYASAAIGRFSMQVDTDTSQCDSNQQPPSFSFLSSPTVSSLSWPIDIQIMSGAQDLHLLLSFPSIASQGRFITFTMTILHLKQGQDKKGRSGAKMNTGTQPTTAAVQAARSLSLLYTIDASSELWLVSGKQAQSFVLAPGEQCSFTVQLLPIASGYLPLPQVELHEQQHVPDGGIWSEAARALHARVSSLPLQSPPVVSSPSRPTYLPIPPTRILRHFAPNHHIHVYPPNTCETQMLVG